MNIERVLKMARGESELETLCMILGNRIDHGSELGGLISVRQFATVAADLLHWRKATSQQVVLTVRSLTVCPELQSTEFTSIQGVTHAGEFILLVEPVGARNSIYDSASALRKQLLDKGLGVSHSTKWFALVRDALLAPQGLVFPLKPCFRESELQWGPRTTVARIASEFGIERGALESLCAP